MAIAAGAGIAAGGSLLSGAMSSSGAKSAANTQADAARYGADLQQKQFDQIRGDLSPYMGAGQTGLMALLGMLGLPGGGGTVGGYGGGAGAMTADQLRQQLLPQFTTQGNPGQPPSLESLIGNVAASNVADASWGFDPATNKWGYKLTHMGGGDAGDPYTSWAYGNPTGATNGSVDEAGLQAAIQQAMAQQNAQGQQAYGAMSGLGKLLQTPFSFDASNLENTPGYQFTLNQGLKSLANQNAAKGLGLSGAQQKGALEYATGLADNTFGQQYQRALQGYMTNYGMASDMFNRLSGLAGMGQNAAAGVGNMGMQNAANIGNLMGQAANAQAASQVAGSNAWGNAINGIGNAGMLYSLMGSGQQNPGMGSSLYQDAMSRNRF